MRGLQVAVIVMGVLIVAGVAVIGVTIARRTFMAQEVPRESIRDVPGRDATLRDLQLDEPEGTRIVAVSGQAPRLAVQLQGGGPDRVVLVDLQDGRILGRLTLRR